MLRGVNVCLTCFNGSCEDTTDPLHNHTVTHYKATSHPVLLNVRRVPKNKGRSEDEPPKKLTKLEIVAEEPESEKYDFNTSVHCLDCNLFIHSDQANVSHTPSMPKQECIDNRCLILCPRCWLRRR